jgi:hypothetical protein
VFKKQAMNWIDYYANGRPKRERIGRDRPLAETVLRKHKVEVCGRNQGGTDAQNTWDL